MNPAQRLLKTYDALVSQGKERPMVKTWAQVFGLDLERPDLDDEVTNCLMALRNELDFTKDLLVRKYCVPNELLEPGFSRFREIGAPALMGQGWHGLKGGITAPESRHAFSWSAWVLRDEAEDDMSAEDMQSLRTEIESLEAAIRDTAMSDYLRAFTKRQVEALRNALRLYEVQGVRPVNEAIEKIAGALTLEQKRLQGEMNDAEQPARETFTRAAQLIDKAAKICENVEKIKKTGETLGGIAGTVGTIVLPYLGKLLG